MRQSHNYHSTSHKESSRDEKSTAADVDMQAAAATAAMPPPKRVPLSLEELLEKKKKEEEALSKPKFLTKAEREALAMQKRQEQVDEQRRKMDETRKANMQFLNKDSHENNGGSSRSQDDSGGSGRDRYRDRADRDRDRDRERAERRDRSDTANRNDSDKPKSHDDKEKEEYAIKERYLGMLLLLIYFSLFKNTIFLLAAWSREG